MQTNSTIHRVNQLPQKQKISLCRKFLYSMYFEIHHKNSFKKKEQVKSKSRHQDIQQIKLLNPVNSIGLTK